MVAPPKQLSISDHPQRLAAKLKALRAALGLSQRQMLDRLGYTGYHNAFLSMWERGYREPPLIVILRYAQICGVSTDVLIDDELELPPKDKPKAKPTVKKSRKRSVK